MFGSPVAMLHVEDFYTTPTDESLKGKLYRKFSNGETVTVNLVEVVK